MKLDVFSYTFLLKNDIKDKLKLKDNVLNKISARLILDDVMKTIYYIWKLYLSCVFLDF
jgi:hypothetical protein